MIPWLQDETAPFPPIDQAIDEPNGLLAAGGTLSHQRLVSAYRAGIFPWYSPGEPILWWSPDPRCVLVPDQLHISKSMRKRLKKDDYHVTFNRNFSAVIDACSAPRKGEDGTWITNEMKAAYEKLHQQGLAHSVEVYIEGELVGGLYGLSMGKLFFGESMFSKVKDCSKIAFIKMVEQLQKWGYALIDCQVSNDHLFSLGAQEISRDEFQRYLDQYIDSHSQTKWEFDS
ncbi:MULTISPECIES: leucyl/phenylalanyl-tRNA--protein transferase [unclassified Neptuniibacter]|jgi:leucyl/phenylalanyl-tRNA--protein transferase|uniref:leucyl/phenylalanyl-tRNA--protein transferase n=1 Tax=unclassified Neptuniibacter TaxID=2630693 RepID=UPI000C61B7FA|nr:MULTISPECIES: leucyl/phenylalanyl-tRNA--protein transferase [unclassified Neptuniibacter]MAY41939.1 leucyl/phenylalanyl-tRNA--protein transferase [Oceanospirillaceae bacterium]|tara:strand:+ start:29078 stop:29764 length:687 start_codon:yes stop_codon:yes gene_type:complete